MSSQIWLFRLDLEWELQDNWEECFVEAKRSVPPNAVDDSGRFAVWNWVLDRTPPRDEQKLMGAIEVSDVVVVGVLLWPDVRIRS